MSCPMGSTLAVIHCYNLLFLMRCGIAVQAGHKEAYTVVGEKRRDKAERQQPGDTFAAPATDAARVQVNRVDQPGYQSRGLFRVPVPIMAPGIVSPVSAQNQRQR